MYDSNKVYVEKSKTSVNIEPPLAQEAITAIWESEKKYDPSVVGYKWDKENPRIQLEPRGKRGYIELVAVKAQ